MRRSSAIVCMLPLVLAGSALAQGPDGRTTSAGVGKDLQESLQGRIRAVQFQGVRAGDALKMLSNMANVRIVCSDDELKATPVDLVLKDVTLEDALNAVLLSISMSTFVEFQAFGDIIRVEYAHSQEQAEARIGLDGVLPSEAPGDSEEELRGILREFAEHLPDGIGRLGDMQVDKGAMVVKASPVYVEHLRRFLEGLRHPLVPQTSSGNPNGTLEAELQTMRKLKQPIPRTLRNTPTLGALLLTLRHHAGVNVAEDVVSLRVMEIGWDHRIRIPDGDKTTWVDVLNELRTTPGSVGHAPDFALRGGLLILASDVVLKDVLLTRVYELPPSAASSAGETADSRVRGSARRTGAVRFDVGALQRKLDPLVDHGAGKGRQTPPPIRLWNGRLIVVSNWRNQWKVVETLGWESP